MVQIKMVNEIIDNQKYDVFISYSRRDKKRVGEFCEIFDKAGISYWMDVVGIENGENFKTVIVKAIEESTVFLYFSSKNSNASPWTAKEVGIAVARKKPIIPIWLDNSPFNKDVEFDLVNLDVVDCTDDDKQQEAVGKLVHSIQCRCQRVISTEAVIAAHFEQKRRRRRRNLLLSAVSLSLLLIGTHCAYAYYSYKKDLDMKETYAKRLVCRADSLLELEVGRCYYDDGIMCYDSVNPAQLILIRNLYDSAYTSLPMCELEVLGEKKDSLQSLIDSAYDYYVEKYKTCVRSKREYTAGFCKERIILLDDYVTLKGGEI